MTSIYDIKSFDDIKLLCENKIRETRNLEFKQEVTKDNKEIAKDISAFANADGGVIIYGVKEDNRVAKESEGIEIDNKPERIQQIASS